MVGGCNDCLIDGNVFRRFLHETAGIGHPTSTPFGNGEIDHPLTIWTGARRRWGILRRTDVVRLFAPIRCSFLLGILFADTSMLYTQGAPRQPNF